MDEVPVRQPDWLSCEVARGLICPTGKVEWKDCNGLERRHILGAELAAKEMGFLPIRDALGLLALYAAEDSPKYGKAATRWLGRLALESDDLSLDDLQLAAAAIQALPRRPDSALRALTDLSRHPAPSGSGTPAARAGR